MVRDRVVEKRAEMLESRINADKAEPEKACVRATNTPSKEENISRDETSLIEQVIERGNMLRAYDKVVKNGGSAGIDGIKTEDLKVYLQKHWAQVKDEILKGEYRPLPVKRVLIPKPKGGVRQLGIPTVQDRLIQQALLQVLYPLFDNDFSENSYGFRKNRKAQDAVLKSKEYQKEGYRHVIDLDLEKFFDEVNHDILMGLIMKKVSDKAVLKLIRRYLQSGVTNEGIHVETRKGTPQGGPLSPLLSNILLDVFDKELEKRGHQFARYADDCNVYVKSLKSGLRVFQSLKNFLEKRLKLKINLAKSSVSVPSKRTFLGYSFTSERNVRMRIPKEVISVFKGKLKSEFRKGRGRNLGRFVKEQLNPIIRGWINYFIYAEVKRFAEDLDGWIRRKLRSVLWRQWKRNWTRRKRLINAGLSEERAVRSAFNRRGPWWNSGAQHMSHAFPKKYFDKIGLVSMVDKLCEFNFNNRNRLGT